MGSYWFLLLLLFLTQDRTLNLPGSNAMWGAASSTESSVVNGTVSCLSTSSALSPSAPVVESNSLSTTKTSTSKSQEQTTSATFPMSPQTSHSTESTEHTTSIHVTWKEKSGTTPLHTLVAATTNGMAVTNSTTASTSEKQEETSNATTLSNLTTITENAKRNQTVPITTPSALNAATPLPVSPNITKAATGTASTTLSTAGNGAGPSVSPTTTVSENSALTPSSTLGTSTATVTMATRAAMSTSTLATAALDTTVLGAVTHGTQDGKATAVSPISDTVPSMSRQSDTQPSTTQQAPPQPEQSTSSVAAPAPASLAAKSTARETDSSVAPNSVKAATGTALMTLSTEGALNSEEDDAELSVFPIATVSEKSTLTPPSAPSTVTKTNETLPVTARVGDMPTSLLTTAVLETTVLETTMSGTQDGKDTAVSPISATTPSMSNTQSSTAQHSLSQPEPLTSGVSTTVVTAPPASKTTVSDMTSSGPPGSERAATSPPSATLNPAGDVAEPSVSPTTTASEKSALTPSSTMGTITDTVTTATRAGMLISTLSTAALDTTVVGTTMSGMQDGKTMAMSPTSATSPSMSSQSDIQPGPAQQTPFQPEQSSPSVSTGTAQSPEATADHSIPLIHSSPETTKSSALAGVNPTAPKSSQSMGPATRDCASDEKPNSVGDCVCNDTYYIHSEPSKKLVRLHCGPQDIEVALSSCFLETRQWVLREDHFSRCSSTKKIQQGLRMQVFQLEKKEGSCGLILSTNGSHDLYSLNIYLEKVLPGSVENHVRSLHFSCAYPLVVTVSQTLPYQGNSIPTIHIPSTGDTIVNLSIFTDSKLSTPLKDSTALVGKPLYVVLNSTSTDPNRFALVVNEVFVSTKHSNTGAAYYFVKDSCQVSSKLQELANGASSQVTVAFTLLRFFDSDTLYLHARVTLCQKRVGRSCQPSCVRKLRKNSPWESRAQDHRSQWIVFGPLRLSGSKASSSRSSAGTWMLIIFLMVIVWMLE